MPGPRIQSSTSQTRPNRETWNPQTGLTQSQEADLDLEANPVQILCTFNHGKPPIAMRNRTSKFESLRKEIEQLVPGDGYLTVAVNGPNQITTNQVNGVASKCRAALKTKGILRLLGAHRPNVVNGQEYVYFQLDAHGA